MNLPSMNTSPDENGLPTVAFSSTSACFGTAPKERFASAVRAKGIVFLPESVLRDLFRNRLDYVKLQERARAVKEERAWEKKLNNSVR